MIGTRHAGTVVGLVSLLALSSCAGFLPGSGPSGSAVEHRTVDALQLIDVDEAVGARLLERQRQTTFAELFGDPPARRRQVGVGDGLELALWEAPPATLFGGAVLETAAVLGTSHATTLPEQVVADDGTIAVPFAGLIPAAGRTLQEISDDVAARLRSKAHQPQVITRLAHNRATTVTVVGEVATSAKVPLAGGTERLLDVLALAGGVRQPVSKTSIQLTRGDDSSRAALEAIIRDPRQNVTLRPGDVVTALFQPFSFTALGASGRNEEIPFEAQGITLNQALARAGGLIDSRSAVRGVFVFRLAAADDYPWPRQPVRRTPSGRVPVVFRFDLSDPATFFVMQSFTVENQDVLYVSNAPVTEMQKFLNVLFSVAYPIMTAKQAGL